jgi:hypothetical protein
MCVSTSGHPPPTGPRDLLAWPHVHDADRKDWSLWFQAQGIEDVGAPRGPAFDDSGLLLQAVLAGQGAGLAPTAMAAADLGGGSPCQACRPRLACVLCLLSRLSRHECPPAEDRSLSGLDHGMLLVPLGRPGDWSMKDRATSLTRQLAYAATVDAEGDSPIIPHTDIMPWTTQAIGARGLHSQPDRE